MRLKTRVYSMLYAYPIWQLVAKSTTGLISKGYSVHTPDHIMLWSLDMTRLAKSPGQTQIPQPSLAPELTTSQS